MRSKFTVLLSALLFGVSTAVAHADSCDDCYTKKEPECAKFCESAKDKDTCLERCSQVKCRKICVFKEVAPPDARKTGAGDGGDAKGCESCLKQMEPGQCQTSCRERENPGQCAKRCAKVKCARKCNLPGSDIEKPNGPVDSRPTAQVCGDCRKKQQILCAPKCGKHDSAGYKACEVACVEEQCLQACNPGLF